GKGSESIPDIVANCSRRAIRFHFANKSGMIQQPGTFEVIILLTDEQFTLNTALLNQIKRYLIPRGRLIVAAPYQASFVGAFQRSFAIGAGRQRSKSNVLSVNALFQQLSAEGFTDPYLRLVGGLPGFWKSSVCSVTPNR
ncbi:MAG: hypothetical protein WBA10_16060, partial [Elainellaceae cyanobacterium]